MNVLFIEACFFKNRFKQNVKHFFKVVLNCKGEKRLNTVADVHFVFALQTLCAVSSSLGDFF